MAAMAVWPPASVMSAEIDWDAPAPSTVLMIAGKKFPLDFGGGEFTIHGTPLVVFETSNSGLGTGLTVWDGSVVLAKFLEARYSTLQGQNVVELGCGPGLAGLTAAALGADVTLTDLDYALDGARAGVARNAAALKGRVDVAELDWYSPQVSSAAASARSADIVLAADVVWVEELIAPLARTLGWIARRPDAAGKPPPQIFIAHQTRARASDMLFSARLREEGLICHPLERSLLHPYFQDAAIEILSIERLHNVDNVDHDHDHDHNHDHDHGDKDL